MSTANAWTVPNAYNDHRLPRGARVVLELLARLERETGQPGSLSYEVLAVRAPEVTGQKQVQRWTVVHWVKAARDLALVEPDGVPLTTVGARGQGVQAFYRLTPAGRLAAGFAPPTPREIVTTRARARRGG